MEETDLKGFVPLVFPGFDYSGLYFINKEGLVYGVMKKGIMKPTYGQTTKNRIVRLRKNGQNRWFHVDRLVNIVFNPGVLKGFEKIPGFSNYLINEKGEIYSVNRAKFLASNHVNSAGYYTVTVNNDHGEPRTMSVHHLVLMTFKPEDYRLINNTWLPGPDGRRMVCDHIDGNKINNHIDNLRVIDDLENYRKERYRYDEKVLTPLIVKDFNSGKVTKYKSITSFCSVTGLCYATVWCRINRPDSDRFIWPEGVLVKYLTDDNEEDQWLPPLGYLTLGKGIVARDFKNNVFVTKEYSSVEEYSKKCMVSVWSISEGLKKKHPVLCNLQQIKEKDDFSEWRMVHDPVLDYIINTVDFRRDVYVMFKENERPILVMPHLRHRLNLNLYALRRKDINGKYRILEYKGYYVVNYMGYIETPHSKRWKNNFTYFDLEKDSNEKSII